MWSVAQKQEARRRKHRRSIGTGEPLGRVPIEGTGVDTRSRTTLDKVDEMAAIGQKPGPHVRDLARR